MVVHACSPGTPEIEARGSWILASLGYIQDPVSKKRKKEKKDTLNVGPSGFLQIEIEYAHIKIIPKPQGEISHHNQNSGETE
jgi:hypothetical protein